MLSIHCSTNRMEVPPTIFPSVHCTYVSSIKRTVYDAWSVCLCRIHTLADIQFDFPIQYYARNEIKQREKIITFFDRHTIACSTAPKLCVAQFKTSPRSRQLTFLCVVSFVLNLCFKCCKIDESTSAK